VTDRPRHEHPRDAPTTVDSSETHPRQLAEFVREHQATLVGVAVRVVRSRSSADDVVQDVLVKIVRRLDQHPDQVLTIEWAVRVTINCALDHLRAVARQAEFVTGLDISNVSSGPADRTTHHTVRTTLAQLPTKVAQAFLLHRVAGYTSREVGAMLKLSESTVRGLTAKAAGALREAITEGDGQQEDGHDGPG
jgi:RNA polymerase sigma-70 factor, ECF subfamily